MSELLLNSIIQLMSIFIILESRICHKAAYWSYAMKNINIITVI